MQSVKIKKERWAGRAERILRSVRMKSHLV